MIRSLLIAGTVLAGSMPAFSAPACVATIQEITHPLAFAGVEFTHLLNHETKKFETALGQKLPDYTATVVVHESAPFAVVSLFDGRGCLRGQTTLPLAHTQPALKKALEKDAKKIQ